MARKKSLDQQRADIKKAYKRGPRKETVLHGKLSELDAVVKQEIACHLKAADFSYRYIGEALGVSVDVTKKWFADEELNLASRVLKIQDDYVQGAVKLLKTYAIELVEMLIEIARTTPDDKIAVQAITEAFDRMGLTKVNKSESAASVVNRTVEEVEITDKAGMIEKLRSAPPEVQAKAAEHMEALLSLTAEHVEMDVTHNA